MKKSLAHLPEQKQDEVELIAFKIRALCEDVQMVILFGRPHCNYGRKSPWLRKKVPANYRCTRPYQRPHSDIDR